MVVVDVAVVVVLEVVVLVAVVVDVTLVVVVVPVKQIPRYPFRVSPAMASALTFIVKRLLPS